MNAPREQKRGRAIAMSTEEVDTFLRGERMCRLASVDGEGRPHNSPLWFVWDGNAIWLNSIVKSQRWTNLMRNPNVALVVDGGDGFFELRGVEILGKVEAVGEAPRTNEPNELVAEAERLFGEKYTGGAFVNDGRHAWLRLVPDKTMSWDFRKIGK